MNVHQYKNFYLIIVSMSIFKLDTDGIKTIWHFGIIDVPCIELYGIIGQMKEKEGESQ